MNTTNKFICIHGHFYQPPRENAWLETVELQDSASPFHDWNERINFECYAPNTAARILDGSEFITKIINNYAHINFNFGPTLLSWMEMKDPETHQAIVEADKISQARFSGHGSAIAQVHSHLILPLCNERDKHTQVIWGIRDFEYRFGRKPEGMWLAETAANVDTLEVLAAHDIKYTILAPRQAKSFKKIGARNWTSTNNNGIDPRRPYLCKLPSGQSIALFFYDGNVAQDVAFNNLLSNGKQFAQRFVDTFDDNDEPQLAHIATDGESYGHHHRHGEMALADAINHIKQNGLATITNYGEYLEKFPPAYEARIHDNSSWSCVHGVERWKSNCGCNTGGRPGWTQAWRSHLRKLLDWLRDKLIPVFEKEAAGLLKHPWEARNNYIHVLLNRSDETVDAFIAGHAKKKLSGVQKTKLLRLMEMQRNAMLMFTSCAWFFDEISGLETNQVLQYALRAIAYAKQVGGVELHKQFLKKLEAAPSNVYETGATSYKRHVMPSQVDLVRVGMHYAVASLFAKDPQEISLFNYKSDPEFFDKIEAGNQKIAVGRVTMNSKITYSKKHFSFAVLYLGQQNIIGNISTDMKGKDFNKMHLRITEAFSSTNLGEVIAIMQEYFGLEKFTVWHLFRDEKRKILSEITERSLKQADGVFREIYNDNYQLMTGMLQSNIPIPETYSDAVQHVLNRDLHAYFVQDRLSIRRLSRMALELKKWKIPLSNEQSFKLAASERLFYEVKKMAFANVPIEHLQLVNNILETIQGMGVELDVWKIQNTYFSMIKGFKNGEWVFVSDDWKDAFFQLGELLQVRSN